MGTSFATSKADAPFPGISLPDRGFFHTLALGLLAEIADGIIRIKNVRLKMKILIIILSLLSTSLFAQEGSRSGPILILEQLNVGEDNVRAIELDSKGPVEFLGSIISWELVRSLEAGVLYRVKRRFPKNNVLFVSETKTFIFSGEKHVLWEDNNHRVSIRGETE